jgi:hypothetical protein
VFVRMCDKVKQLINAHIIPRKFFEGIRGTHKYAVQVDSSRPLKDAGTFYQAGIADKKILCEECERAFSDFDTYGWNILGKLSLGDPLQDENGSYAHKIVCDTDKIRRFGGHQCPGMDSILASGSVLMKA